MTLVDDHVRISKYKKFLQKVTFHIGLKKILWLKKLKILCRGHVIEDLNGEEILEMLYERELQKTNQTEFRVEKVIKRKYDILHAKWKGYDHSFDHWIDKKDRFT